MFGLIKSIGTKAISSLPVFTNSRTKIILPHDPNLQQKLQQISTQILKAQTNQQFKIYQQLQSIQGANFNRSLRKIYQYEQCTTQSINAIIRFYTFLLTNCKNQLVICKLVSQPLVIQLTKIVLHIQQGKDQQIVGDKQILKQYEQGQQQEMGVLQTDVMDIGYEGGDKVNTQQQKLEQVKNFQDTNTKANSSTTTTNTNTNKKPHISPLHYTSYIDWDQVNAYKVALIRAYINCINSQTINYMIIDNQLPIFVNCINGYKHYLTQGVEGTCISNCILMILTKVDHNDQVCGIVFDQRHHVNSLYNKKNIIGDNKMKQQQKQQKMMQQGMLSKSISIEKSIKLHQFIQQVIVKISQQLQIVLTVLSQSLITTNQYKQQQQIPKNLQNTTKIIQPNTSSSQSSLLSNLLTFPRKLQSHQQFIQSNILFCVDLINSISNYNYTSRIKQAIGDVIQKQLIQKVVKFVNIKNHNSLLQSHDNITTSNKIRIEQNRKRKRKNESNQTRNRFNLILLKLTKHILNLSITCQKQHLMIKFLNQQSINILTNIIEMNDILFIQSQQLHKQQQSHQQQTPIVSKTFINNTDHHKHLLTYICNYSLILLKQVMSSYSKLSSRKNIQKNNQQINQLKQSILQKIFVLIQQLTKYKQLKQNVCYKTVRNLLLAVFYLTIKEDKCSVQMVGKTTRRKEGKSKSNIQNDSQQLLQKDKQKLLLSKQQQTGYINISSYKQNNQTSLTHKANQISTLALTFNYSILLLHKTFSQHFKQLLKSNTNWQFIVNNYQTLMRQVPNTILSPQQSDKYCHYHNNNNYQLQDQIRDRILVYEAVRNYRYMIIHQINLQSRLIRLENIYHKHFLSPGWGYTPGEVVKFNSNQQYKIVCTGLLHNNNLLKLPIQILQDSQCLLITHKISQNQLKIIANIRYKKIGSFIPQGKSMIRLKLIGIQELILQFGSIKMLQVFKQYLNQNRNKTREKQLKFINYYLNLYLKDTQEMIGEIYEREIVGDDVEGDMNIDENKKQTEIKVNGCQIDSNNIQLQNKTVQNQNKLIQEQIIFYQNDKNDNSYQQNQQKEQQTKQQNNNNNQQIKYEQHASNILNE